jgi:chromosome segregation ATPase
LLDEMRGKYEALLAQLADSMSQLAASDTTLQARNAALEQRDARVAQFERDLSGAHATITALGAERDELRNALATERESQLHTQHALSARTDEIGQLQGSAEQLQSSIAALQQQLAAEQSAHGNQHNQLGNLERELAQSRAQHDILTSDLASARTRIEQLTAEVLQTASAQDALRTRSDELQRSQDELAAVQQELDEVRTSLVTKHSELAEREQAMRSAQEVVADLREANQQLEAQREEQQQRLTELETREREREEGVLANAANLAAARRQLSQQLAAVQSMEQALRARDTLSERLRTELQLAQDERAIMQGQLEKSRTRNRSMAREVFARDSQIAALKADLAVHVETLAAIRQDVNRASTADDGEHPDRILEPVGHDADIIVLDKKMMTIGRTSDNDICIPSKLVSRNHARLLIGPNAVIVEDAGSTNGCLVNDIQVKQHLMRDGDVLAIGDLKYRLRTRTDTATPVRDNVIPFGEGRHTD